MVFLDEPSTGVDPVASEVLAHGVNAFLTGVDTVSSFERHGKKKQHGVLGWPHLKPDVYLRNSPSQIQSSLQKT